MAQKWGASMGDQSLQILSEGTIEFTPDGGLSMSGWSFTGGSIDLDRIGFVVLEHLSERFACARRECFDAYRQCSVLIARAAATGDKQP